MAEYHPQLSNRFEFSNEYSEKEIESLRKFAEFLIWRKEYQKSGIKEALKEFIKEKK